MRFPSCSRCATSADLRDLWNCEGATPESEPIYSVRCSPCEGEDCSACEGTGRVNVYECPSRILARAGAQGRAVSRGIQAYQRCEAWAAPPAPGGQLAQSAAFGDLCEEVDAERAAWNEERRS